MGGRWRCGGKTWPLCSVDRGCREVTRLSSEEVPILFSVIARLSLCVSLSLLSPLLLFLYVCPSLSLVGPLMLYDGLSWVLSVEPPAPSACLSFVPFHSLYLSFSLEDHFYPTYFLLQSLKPPTPPPHLQPTYLSSPLFLLSRSVCPLHVLWLHLFVLRCPDVLI